MIWTERRETPRMRVEGLAYINLEPNNGGIILNVSEGGLCFQSAAPVHHTATVRFWYPQGNNGIEVDGESWSTTEAPESPGSHFIEADSELAWIDDSRKRGGLRFTNLPAESRKEIRNWIRQHAPTLAVDEKPALSPSPLRESPSLSAPLGRTTAARPGFATPTVLSPIPQPRTLLTGFSGGLIAGILISSLVTGLFILQSHRREIGQSLIQLGERLGGRSRPQATSADLSAGLPELQMALTETRPPSSKAQPVSRDQIPVSRPERLLAEPHAEAMASAAKPPALKIEAPPPVAATPPPTTTPKAPAATTTSSSTPSPSSAPTISAVSSTVPASPILPAAVPETKPASQPGVAIVHSKTTSTGSLSEKFLEVGKFNDKLWADKTTNQLSQFGYPARVVQKNSFWKKSYQVLVGPYTSDDEAEAAHKTLASRGFSPRSFERGTRGFTMPPALTLAGARMPVGDCVISWESYIPDALVKFKSSERGLAVTGEGTWVKRNVRYYEDAVVYTKNKDGSRNLVEIRFSGMKQALVFDRENF